MEPFLDFGLFELAIASFIGFVFKRARGRVAPSPVPQPLAPKDDAGATPSSDARETPHGEDHGR